MAPSGGHSSHGNQARKEGSASETLSRNRSHVSRRSEEWGQLGPQTVLTCCVFQFLPGSCISTSRVVACFTWQFWGKSSGGILEASREGMVWFSLVSFLPAGGSPKQSELSLIFHFPCQKTREVTQLRVNKNVILKIKCHIVYLEKHIPCTNYMKQWQR